MDNSTNQSPYRCRLDWGAGGALAASERGDILVIVDTLSFSTAVATAVAHGGVIVPCSDGVDAIDSARAEGGEAAVARRDVPVKGRFSLSPLTFIGIEPGTKVWLKSPNGAACARAAGKAPALFVGALVNARATAAAVADLLVGSELCVTVIACGEREGSGLRFAIEDYLGAGAVLNSLAFDKSPEAQVCAAAYESCQNRLPELIWDCASGRELRAKGFEGDVRHAAQSNLYEAAAVLRDGALCCL